MRFRDDADDLAGMDDNGAVEQAALMAKGGGANKQDRIELLACRNDRGDGFFDGVEEHVLAEKVIDRVTRDTKFREDHERHVLGVALAG